jgi:hypothetical protein
VDSGFSVTCRAGNIAGLHNSDRGDPLALRCVEARIQQASGIDPSHLGSFSFSSPLIMASDDGSRMASVDSQTDHSENNVRVAAPPARDTHGGTESKLSCRQCRARKLRCDRIMPICGRCIKSGSDCTFPGSRMKQTGNKRSVKDLEARLGRRSSSRDVLCF